MSFPGCALALSGFVPPFATRRIPEKVNLNLITFYRLEIHLRKSCLLVYLLCLNFSNWGFVSLFIEGTNVYIHIFKINRYSNSFW